MPPKNDQEKTYNECKGPGAHREHLCLLMEQGRTREVNERAQHPAFVCRNCGARADEQKDLCNPKPL